jgi:hypothetical protein
MNAFAFSQQIRWHNARRADNALESEHNYVGHVDVVPASEAPELPTPHRVWAEEQKKKRKENEKKSGEKKKKKKSSKADIFGDDGDVEVPLFLRGCGCGNGDVNVDDVHCLRFTVGEGDDAQRQFYGYIVERSDAQLCKLALAPLDLDFERARAYATPYVAKRLCGLDDAESLRGQWIFDADRSHELGGCVLSLRYWERSAQAMSARFDVSDAIQKRFNAKPPNDDYDAFMDLQNEPPARLEGHGVFAARDEDAQLDDGARPLRFRFDADKPVQAHYDQECMSPSHYTRGHTLLPQHCDTLASVRGYRFAGDGHLILLTRADKQLLLSPHIVDHQSLRQDNQDGEDIALLPLCKRR